METNSQSLLTFLMNGAWQAALIASAAALCDWLLRSAPARRRHKVWVAALALSLGLPVVTSSHLLKGAFFGARPRKQTVVNQAADAPALLSEGIVQGNALDA